MAIAKQMLPCRGQRVYFAGETLWSGEYNVTKFGLFLLLRTVSVLGRKIY